MLCSLKVTRGLNHCWRQLRLLSYTHFDWRESNSGSWVEHPMDDRTKNVNMWDSGRRHILQSSEEHQRRQQTIIEDSKRKWNRGREALPPGTYKSNLIYNAGGRRMGQSNRPRRDSDDPDREAKDYSRKRRYQRQKEVKRQAYELEKSRRGYNLPKPDETPDENRDYWDKTMNRGGDEAQAQDQYEHSGTGEDSKYWHYWQPCPSQRCEEDLEYGEDYYPSRGSRGGPKRPHKGYYSSHRSMHHLRLPSIRSPNYQSAANRLVGRRKPMGMEKRFNHLMKQYLEDELLQNEPDEEEDEEEEELSQAPRRYGSENERMERMVKPPSYHMTVHTEERTPVPVCSYSEQLTMPPTRGGNYRACTRGSLCDMSH